MKQHVVFFSAPEQAELREVDVPDTPLGPEEIAGPTVASVISPGTELAVYQGQLATGSFPTQSGYAAVLRVEQLGSEITGLSAGDLVLAMCPHQSWQRLPASEALPVPEGLSAREAGFARLMNIGLSALTTTTARPPAPVLITGLGLVGHLAALIFDRCGYEVLAVDPLESRRRLARSAGLCCVLESVPLDDPALAGQVELALECSGHEQATLEACRMVRRRGEVVLAGVPWARRTDLSAHELLYEVFHRYAVLRSGWEWEVPTHAADFRRGSLFEQMAAGMKWLAAGDLFLAEGLYDVAAPENATEVYAKLLRREGTGLTTVFEWIVESG